MKESFVAIDFEIANRYRTGVNFPHSYPHSKNKSNHYPCSPNEGVCYPRFLNKGKFFTFLPSCLERE